MKVKSESEVAQSCPTPSDPMDCSPKSRDFALPTKVLLVKAIVFPVVMYALEKAMAPHSSTLAWKIPWMEEPDRLQSMGSLRVRHD